MHARCDTDPLDFATDVCDDCGGEYCDAHLVRPYGPKRPPLCRRCAIALSGVRSGGAPVRKRSRSQIKRRRAELRQQRADGPATLGFELFDAPSDVGWSVPAVEPAVEEEVGPAPAPDIAATDGDGATGAGRRSLARRLGLGRRSDRSTEDQGGGGDRDVADPDQAARTAPAPGPTPAPSSATVLLTRLREAGAVPAGTPQDPRARTAAPVPVGASSVEAEVEGEADADEARAEVDVERGPVETSVVAPPAAAVPARPPTPGASAVTGAEVPSGPAPLPRRRPAVRPAPAGPGAGDATWDRAARAVPYAPPGFSAWPVDRGDEAAPRAHAPAVPVVDTPRQEDDPWADVPPALRGPGHGSKAG